MQRTVDNGWVTNFSAGEALSLNLQALRSRQRLSLSELARRSGLSKATLSALEAGAGNPTIETVFGLARALEVRISDLLEYQTNDDVTVVRTADQVELQGVSVDLRPLQTLEIRSARVEIYDQVIRPGDRQRSRGHIGSEHTIVQAGRLNVEVNDTSIDLGPGDYIRFDASLPHSYQALDGVVRSTLLLQYDISIGLTESSPVTDH